MPEALSLLPPDSGDDGFERLADHQSVSRIHLEGYWAAAVEASATLASTQAYDSLNIDCADAIMPPAQESVTRHSKGAELALDPIWAIFPDENNPDHIYLTYAAQARAVAAVSIAAPGTYDLELRIDVAAQDFPHLDIELDGQIVDTARDLKGPQTLRSRIEIAHTGPHTITYQFDATGTEVPDNVQHFLYTVVSKLGEASLPRFGDRGEQRLTELLA